MIEGRKKKKKKEENFYTLYRIVFIQLISLLYSRQSASLL